MNETTNSLNIGNIISQAWELTKKHLPVFLLLMILTQAVGSLPSAGYYGAYMKMLFSTGGALTEEEWIQHYVSFSNLFSFFLLWLLAGIVGWYLTLVNSRMLHDAVEGYKVDLTAQLKESFKF